MSRRFAALVVAVLMGWGFVGCASSKGETGSTNKAGTPTTTVGANRSGPFRVGRRSVVMVDRSRPTKADPVRHLPRRPYRRLPVMLLYPASGPPGRGGPAGTTEPVEGAALARGRFPLVVFSHGITASGPVYVHMLSAWARAGYVIAAPTFPLTGPGTKFPGDTDALTDYQNQPADVRFVMSQVLAGRAGTTAVSAHVADSEVGVAGHSLGAITTLGLVENSCCHDRRVKAAISLSGIELPFPHGSFNDPPSLPLLLVHGTADKTVPVAGSDRVFATAKPPVYELRLTNASHTQVAFNDTYLRDTNAAVIAFFDAYLEGKRQPLGKIPALVRRSGLGQWKARTR